MSREESNLEGERVPFWRGVGHLLTASARLFWSPGWWGIAALFGLLGYAGLNYARSLTPVTLIVDGTTRRVYTHRQTVGELLHDTGILFDEWDRVSPEPYAPLNGDTVITVQHARQVMVRADGNSFILHTHQHDIDALLAQASLALGPGDRLWANGELATAPLTDTLAPRVPSARGERPTPAAPVIHLQIERAAALYVQDEARRQTLYTTQRTVGQALHEAGLLLYAGDWITPELNAPATHGLHVYITRAIPISLTLDGRTIHLRTHAHTVAQVLAAEGISLVGQDQVIPDLDMPIETGINIRVVRVADAFIVEQEEIPYQTVWVADATLELDQRRLENNGTNGIKKRRYKAIYYDGREVERRLEDEWIDQEPQERRIAYGTKIVIRQLETESGTIEYWRRMRIFLTSYTEATCGKTPADPWYGKTRIGWQMRHGIIAVDPRVIPMLTNMYVPGYGPGIAADTGGMIKGMHIDLGYDVSNFVMFYKWGYVYLLTPVPPASQIRWILPDFPRER